MTGHHTLFSDLNVSRETYDALKALTRKMDHTDKPYFKIDARGCVGPSYLRFCSGDGACVEAYCALG